MVAGSGRQGRRGEGMVEQMDQQAGSARPGPAGSNDVRDSAADGRERAGSASGVDPAGAETGQVSGVSEQSTTAIGPRLPSPGSPVTGEPRVDAALKLLDRLPGLPVSEHPQLFEQVHAQLSEVLDELDSGAGGASQSGG